jgi:integrase
MINLTSPIPSDTLLLIPIEEGDMKGKVYSHGKGFRVYFKGEWFSHDEFGRPLKSKFYAYSFLEHLNALYDPDPAKNRYHPSKFKNKTPYKLDEAFALYLDRKQTDSGWQKAKEWIWKKYFMVYFANQDFRTIDDVQLQAFVKWLEGRDLKGKTIKNILMMLHGFLNYFKRSINIFPQFPSISYQQPRPKKFTDKEIDQVFEFIQEQDRGYFLFIRYYGVRPEEASGLLRSAINWETGEITISTVFVNGRVKPKTKTMKERGLPIIPEIEPYLKSTTLSTFVFQIGRHPYTRHVRESRWNRAMKQAVQKYSARVMTLRDLRSSATSRWLKKGMLIQDAAQLLGNSPEIIRKHYSDQTENKVVEIVRGKT